MMDLRAVVADALDDAVHEHLYADCGDGVSWRDGGREALAGIVLAALTAAGPSEKMVEAGARGMCGRDHMRDWDGTGPDPRDPLAVLPPDMRETYLHNARACLTAALAAEGE